jgi:hypothetical protein
MASPNTVARSVWADRVIRVVGTQCLRLSLRLRRQPPTSLTNLVNSHVLALLGQHGCPSLMTLQIGIASGRYPSRVGNRGAAR